MKVIVRNGFCEKLFINESGSLIARLRNAKLFGPQKAVISPDNTVKYKTDIEHLPGRPAGKNRRYLLIQGNTPAATARPEYAADADHFSILPPPRPAAMNIQLSDGALWRVERGKHNDVKIHTPEGTGSLSDFFSIRPQVFEIPGGVNVFLWAGLYALIGYMMHEDDIYPV